MLHTFFHTPQIFSRYKIISHQYILNFSIYNTLVYYSAQYTSSLLFITYRSCDKHTHFLRRSYLVCTDHVLATLAVCIESTQSDFCAPELFGSSHMVYVTYKMYALKKCTQSKVLRVIFKSSVCVVHAVLRRCHSQVYGFLSLTVCTQPFKLCSLKHFARSSLSLSDRSLVLLSHPFLLPYSGEWRLFHPSRARCTAIQQ